MANKLFYFNPGHEAAILHNSPYYMPPANVAIMQKDLAYLPAWIADSGDYVFIPERLPKTCEEHLSACSISLAKGIAPSLLSSIPSDADVHLWGVSPQAIYTFEEINNQYNMRLRLPKWDIRLRKLSSRETAHECLSELCQAIPGISKSIIPRFCSRLEDIEAMVENCAAPLLAKAPYSSSGRGLLWLPVGSLTRTERQILHGMLRKQGSVSIEKAMNKQLDFAMEFSLPPEGDILFEGYSLFQTNSKGAYLGNCLDTQRHIEERITSFITADLLEATKKQLKETLTAKFGGIYSGCIGVDMMIYEEQGTFRLHPCLEINVRYNMGLLAIRFCDKYLHPDSTGMFYIDFHTDTRSLLLLDKEMRETHPLLFDGKVKSGYLPLCPVTPGCKYRAYVLVKEKEL
jgi:hypothetical protein